MTAAPTGRLAGLAIGGAAALFLLAVAAIRLDAQGVYYDEVHQAAGAFAYVGKPPEFFCAAALAGVPVLTVPYQGTLKTAVYGLWMRLSGAGFELTTWRWLGMLLAAAGIVAFSVLAAPSLPAGRLAVFCLLVVSDVTALLGCRNDYGPFAVGLLLRLLLLGAWLARPAGAPRSPSNSFALALLAGQLIYEKLHYVVLLLPLSLIVLGEPERRGRAHRAAALAGVAVGTLPLAIVNLASLAARGELVSLHAVRLDAAPSAGGLLRDVVATLSLGAGHQLRRHILGDEWPLWATMLELLPATGLLAWAALRAWTQRRTPAGRRLAVLVASVVTFPVLLSALPRVVWVQHWLVSTPLLALAAVLAIGRPEAGAHVPRGLAAARAAMAAWLAVRAALLGAAAVSLSAGHASHRWDPSLTRFAAFAAARSDRAAVVGADWGVAVQAYCFADGAPGFAFEPFWSSDWQRALDDVRSRAGSRAVYVALLRPPFGVAPERTRAILAAFEDRSLWQEAPVEEEIACLSAVAVRKFTRMPARADDLDRVALPRERRSTLAGTQRR
jgi:hypothetical protein